jgi:hypothetical protein
MKVAVLAASSNRPDLVRSLAGYLDRNAALDYDLYVVEEGTDDDRLCEFSTVRIPEGSGKGTTYAHNVILEEARQAAKASGVAYDYYWVLMGDVAFAEGEDAMAVLVSTMEQVPELGILSPTSVEGTYPASAREPAGGWRPVATCNYRAFMIRGEVIETVGFLNPEFRLNWGAIHELSHLLHANGWTVGYSDDVDCRHLQAAGAPHRGSSPDVQKQAKRFAYTYFSQIYGPDWSRIFMEAARSAPHGQAVSVNTYSLHRDIWSEALTPEERARVDQPVQAEQAPAPPATPVSQSAPTGAALLKLNLGCGADKRRGWVNVDLDPLHGPDVRASADHLPMILDASCETIDARHLLQHLDYAQAKAAFAEWDRVLVDGGELHLELPNLARCVELVGHDVEGVDLGLALMFGLPSEDAKNGHLHLNRWAWTSSALIKELQEAGFTDAHEESVTAAVEGETPDLSSMRVVAHARSGSAPVTPSHSDSDGIVLANGATMDATLARQMTDLQPWLYPVEMKGMIALPGVGGTAQPEALVQETAQRAKALVAHVTQNVDVRGKSILDLGSNCGFWSSHYADAGAARVLGIEGQELFVHQASLYWRTNQFLPEGAYRFEHADLDAHQTWEKVQAEGPFDVTLCAGILEHVPNYLAVIEQAASVTQETLIIDTALVDGAEKVQGSSEGEFNSLPGTKSRVVPAAALLEEALATFGFGVNDQGMTSYEDSNGRTHMVFIAEKVAAPVSPRESHLVGGGA